MPRWTWSLLLALAAATVSVGQGRIIFEGLYPPPTNAASRFVRIWLPPSYERDPARRYPVLYVHDGQNAFTSAGTNAAFGWGSWELDRVAGELMLAGKLREAILVAIDCTQARYLDYRGPAHRQRAINERPHPKSESEYLPAMGDNSHYEAYRRFLTAELKPQIDREFRTLTNADSTAVLGSSMGGICSIVLAWERPDVFGGAASLSGSFQIERREFLHQLAGAQRPLKSPRLYLDSGVRDYAGGDDGHTNTLEVVNELRRLGWRDGVVLLHLVDDHFLNNNELAESGLRRDKWREARTSQHNEFYWRRRVGRALIFLFPPE